MTIIVAVTDSAESRHALVAAVAESRQLGSELVVVRLGNADLDVASVAPDDVAIVEIDRHGLDKGAQVEAVLDEIDTHHASRLVIGVRRRTPAGKALLGSLSQSLLLTCPIPVLAVKLPEDAFRPSSFRDLPAGLVRVTG